jgi:hypothetical protein
MVTVSSVSFRTTVLSVVGIILGLGAISVLVFQARYLIIGPQISLITEPIGPQNERQVMLAGNARNISRLWLNDRQIFTDPDGDFTELIVLENGQSIQTLRATDRYGRTTTVERSVVYAPMSFYQ